MGYRRQIINGIIILLFIGLFIGFNFTSFFPIETELPGSFSNYYHTNREPMNSFVDPLLNNPTNLLNNPTNSILPGTPQSFNENKYYIGNSYQEFITPKLDSTMPSNLSHVEKTTICTSIRDSDCTTSSYCVLVGDDSNIQKCVPGNVQGPLVSYSDINVDYYYYQNQCYGNCPSK
jgi:hypothetical protein